MDAFAIAGFTFGTMGFVFALISVAGIKTLKVELENLRKEVQELKERRAARIEEMSQKLMESGGVTGTLEAERGSLN